MREVVPHLRGVRIAGYDAVRIVLGLLLLSAAALKGHQLATEPVAGTGLLDSRWFLIGVVEFELFFGLWLLAGLYPKWTWAAALSCFALFAGVSLWKALSGEASCGCFGKVPLNPWYTATLDLAIVLSLLYWRPRGQESLFTITLKELPIGVAPILLVWLLVGVPAAVAMGTYRPAMLTEDGVVLGDGNLVILEPEKWIGKRFPLLPFVEDQPGDLRPDERSLRQRLAEGEWIVVLYQKGCPKCRSFLADVQRDFEQRMWRNKVAGSLAVIGTTSAKTVSCPEWCEVGSLADQYHWFLTTPITCRIRGGIVEECEWPNQLGRESLQVRSDR